MSGTLITLWIIWTAVKFGLPPLLKVATGVEVEIPLLGYLGGMVGIYGTCGINIVNQWSRRPVMRLGKYVTTLGPGVRWIDPILNHALEDWSIRDTVDLIEVNNVQTHDNVPISFSMAFTRRVTEEGLKALITEVGDGWRATATRAVVAATECISNSELDEILHERGALSERMVKVLQGRVQGWGAAVVAMELRDIKITDEGIQDAISMKARARKEGEAELARAEIQQRVAKQLHLAAKEYDSESWKLKGMETLLELCRSAENNTVLIPTDILGAVAQFSGKIQAK